MTRVLSATVLAVVFVTGTASAHSEECLDITGDGTTNTSDLTTLADVLLGVLPESTIDPDANPDKYEGMTYADLLVLFVHILEVNGFPVCAFLPGDTLFPFSWQPSPGDTVWLPRVGNIPDSIQELELPVRIQLGPGWNANTMGSLGEAIPAIPATVSGVRESGDTTAIWSLTAIRSSIFGASEAQPFYGDSGIGSSDTTVLSTIVRSESPREGITIFMRLGLSRLAPGPDSVTFSGVPSFNNLPPHVAIGSWVSPYEQVGDVRTAHTVTVDLEQNDYCCVGTTGNVDYSADGEVNLADLSKLVNILFIAPGEFACPKEADVDANGGVSLSDLSTLIDHLFITFSPLPACVF